MRVQGSHAWRLAIAIAAALGVAVVGGACKSKAGAECEVQSDCSGDLICWCHKWAGPYACKRGRETCTRVEEASAECRLKDVCRSGGECEAPTRAALAPDAIAMCTATAAGCPTWEGCRRTGQCTMARGLCVATSAEACKRSEDCAHYGSCTLTGETCLPSTDAECAASEVCKTEGKCKLGKYGVCDK